MPERSLKADVAIVGAGVAGCAAAIQMARSGRRVVIFEKRRHPRDKTCGGCLSGRAVKFLRELLPAGDTLPGTAGTIVQFSIGRYRIRTESSGHSRLVSRRDLDYQLARVAVQSGALLIEDQAAVPVRESAGWVLRAGAWRVEALTILIAAGLGGFARTLGIDGFPTTRHMAGQSWTQSPGPGLPPAGEVWMHWMRGGYVGLATCDAGQCIVGYAAEVTDDENGSLWLRLRRQNPGNALWNSLPEDAPKRFEAQGAAGFPWSPRRLGVDNCLLIGDAAGYVEPFTGEGMGQALCSARCASQAILAGGAILDGYEQRMNDECRTPARRLRWLGAALRNPALQWVSHLPPVVPNRWLAPLIQRIHVGHGEFA